MPATTPTMPTDQRGGDAIEGGGDIATARSRFAEGAGCGRSLRGGHAYLTRATAITWTEPQSRLHRGGAVADRLYRTYNALIMACLLCRPGPGRTSGASSPADGTPGRLEVRRRNRRPAAKAKTPKTPDAQISRRSLSAGRTDRPERPLGVGQGAEPASDGNGRSAGHAEPGATAAEIDFRRAANAL